MISKIQSLLQQDLEICAKATEGPWNAQDYTGEPKGYLGVAAPAIETFLIAPELKTLMPDDARFIAHSRNSFESRSKALAVAVGFITKLEREYGDRAIGLLAREYRIEIAKLVGVEE